VPGRVPFIPQAEIADCGFVCLAMVLRSFGRYVSCDELRRCATATAEGLSAYQLVALARDQGLTATASRLHADNLDQLETPAILHWEGNHFVVLERVAWHGVRVVDPRIGRRGLSPQQVLAAFSGIALEFRPNDGFVKRAVPWRSLAQRAVISGLGTPLLLFALTVLVLAILAAGWPWLLVALRSGDGAADYVLAARSYLAVLGIELTRAVLIALRDGRLRAVRRKLHGALEQRIEAALERQPLTFFERRAPAALAERVVAGSAACELVLQAMLGLANVATVLVAWLAAAQLSGLAGWLLACTGVLKLGVVALVVLRPVDAARAPAPGAGDAQGELGGAARRFYARTLQQLAAQYDSFAWIAVTLTVAAQWSGSEPGLSVLLLPVLQALVLRRIGDIGETVLGFGELVRRVGGLWDILDLERRS
jgi:ABC-type bacteriocin/lantibiotic exporter with double-glycine peptidase domain